MLLLHERVSYLEGLTLAMIILGIVLVSTCYQDILTLLQKRSFVVLVGKGILWAYVALLSLGCMDFSIGARTPTAGWFPPVSWTRTFSTILLCLVAFHTAKRKGQISIGVEQCSTSSPHLPIGRMYSISYFFILFFLVVSDKEV